MVKGRKKVKRKTLAEDEQKRKEGKKRKEQRKERKQDRNLPASGNRRIPESIFIEHHL